MVDMARLLADLPKGGDLPISDLQQSQLSYIASMLDAHESRALSEILTVRMGQRNVNVATRLDRLLTDHQAQQEFEAILNPPRAGVWHSGASLALLPQPQWLAAPFIPHGGIVLLSGAGGTGKTQLALGIALAMGNPEASVFPGHEVSSGRVCIVEAEGVEGLNQRKRAWAAHWGVDGDTIDDHVDYLAKDEPLADLDAEQIIARHRARPYSLIILDTAAKLFRLESENDNALVSNAVFGPLMRLRAELERDGAAPTILLIHHVTETKDTRGKVHVKTRGASAFRDNADTVVILTGTPTEGLTITTAGSGKQRQFEAATLDGFTHRAAGESFVVAPMLGAELDEVEQRKLSALDLVPLEGIQATAWQKAIGGRTDNAKALIQSLVDEGRVQRTSRQAPYKLTRLADWGFIEQLTGNGSEV